MKSSSFLGLVIVLLVSGCASSSDLDKRASSHAKARDYYESIGQPNAAQEENREANKDWNKANMAFPLLVELFNLFNEKEK